MFLLKNETSCQVFKKQGIGQVSDPERTVMFPSAQQEILEFLSHRGERKKREREREREKEALTNY